MLRYVATYKNSVGGTYFGAIDILTCISSMPWICSAIWAAGRVRRRRCALHAENDNLSTLWCALRTAHRRALTNWVVGKRAAVWDARQRLLAFVDGDTQATLYTSSADPGEVPIRGGGRQR